MARNNGKGKEPYARERLRRRLVELRCRAGKILDQQAYHAKLAENVLRTFEQEEKFHSDFRAHDFAEGAGKLMEHLLDFYDRNDFLTVKQMETIRNVAEATKKWVPRED